MIVYVALGQRSLGTSGLIGWRGDSYFNYLGWTVTPSFESPVSPSKSGCYINEMHIFSIIGKMSLRSDEIALRVGFGPRAVVWRP